MMLRRLLPGIWRRRRVDDQDDVATEDATRQGTGHSRYRPIEDHDPRIAANAAWLARLRQEEEELALLLTLLADD